jgi:hypothetical protein
MIATSANGLSGDKDCRRLEIKLVIHSTVGVPGSTGLRSGPGHQRAKSCLSLLLPPDFTRHISSAGFSSSSMYYTYYGVYTYFPTIIAIIEVVGQDN